MEVAQREDIIKDKEESSKRVKKERRKREQTKER